MLYLYIAVLEVLIVSRSVLERLQSRNEFGSQASKPNHHSLAPDVSTGPDAYHRATSRWTTELAR